MLNKFKDFFSQPSQAKTPNADDPKLAVAALLFEAAASDGLIEDAEQDRIRALLAQHYTLSDADAQTLCADALEMQKNAIEISRFTRAAKEQFAFEERVELVEMLWDVVYADGHVDDYEANLMRRIGGLIYVDDKTNGEARKRVAARLGLS